MRICQYQHALPMCRKFDIVLWIYFLKHKLCEFLHLNMEMVQLHRINFFVKFCFIQWAIQKRVLNILLYFSPEVKNFTIRSARSKFVFFSFRYYHILFTQKTAQYTHWLVIFDSNTLQISEYSYWVRLKYLYINIFTFRLEIEYVDEDTLIATDGNGNRIVVSFQPISIQFYHDDILQSIFDGSRLIMQNVCKN